MPPSERRSTPDQWPRLTVAIVTAIALVGFLWVTRPSGGSGETTSTTTGSVPEVPASPDPAQLARNLAEWLRSQAD